MHYMIMAIQNSVPVMLIITLCSDICQRTKFISQIQLYLHTICMQHVLIVLYWALTAVYPLPPHAIISVPSVGTSIMQQRASLL